MMGSEGTNTTSDASTTYVHQAVHGNISRPHRSARLSRSARAGGRAVSADCFDGVFAEGGPTTYMGYDPYYMGYMGYDP